ncbi:SRPBCC domain-containing protein [Novosphingobium sp.]|uniref:SRPBCC domain-containing protein n=1 Tax=Novosphingobium sp. TaxID=1874826 RepID=UPI003B51566A
MAPNDAITTTQRTSDTELVVTRIVNAPRNLVYRAWAEPDLFRQWWAPASFGVTIVSHESDMRTGGSYRLMMDHASLEAPMAFYGTYLEVVPGERIVRTNDEGTGPGPVSTVTFEDHAGGTLVTVHERYPSKDALDQDMASGATSGWTEQYAQLDQLMQSEAQA